MTTPPPDGDRPHRAHVFTQTEGGWFYAAHAGANLYDHQGPFESFRKAFDDLSERYDTMGPLDIRRLEVSCFHARVNAADRMCDACGLVIPRGD